MPESKDKARVERRPQGAADKQPSTGQAQQPGPAGVPSTESSSEYEGAPSRKPTGNPAPPPKAESSSEYEGAPSRKPAAR